MLAVLFIFGALLPLNIAELSIGLVNDGVVTSKFTDSFLLRYPDCNEFANRSGELLYQEVNDKENKTQSFKVPPCSEKAQFIPLNNLKNGTEYKMWYKIGDNISQPLTNKTNNKSDFTQINDGLPARSGAMVVITVILSLAMVVLLAGLIVSLFFSN